MSKIQKVDPMYVQVADHLRNRIISGRWHEGKKFYSQMEIAREFEVSTRTAREALDLLKDEGFLRSVDKSGRFVEPRSKWKINTTE